MAKKTNGARISKTPITSVLTQQDANKFKKSAKIYAETATSSKKKAQSTLKSLGIYTESGRLSKRYG